MKCIICHEASGRMRVHLCIPRLSLSDADLTEAYFSLLPGVKAAKVYDRTCDMVLLYSCPRAELIQALAAFSLSRAAALIPAPEHTARALNREFEDGLVFSVLHRAAVKLFFPAWARAALTVLRSLRYLWAGLRALCRGRLSVSVLDATAIAVSLLRRDFNTAGSVMFLLHIGEMLEDWTHKKSVSDLAGAMALPIDKVWKKTGDAEVLVALNLVCPGDRIVVRTGNLIPLDGKVESGEASVNQSSMTGESLPVRKGAGSYVYAGTVVEEGECVICVEKAQGQGRYDRIVHMIEESEKLKSATEARAFALADRLVPYTLGGAGLTYLLTRNVTKALSVLMVDFSCALKLSMPIAVLSAMRQGTKFGISVKGGKFLEAAAKADTVVFDKTGTLTYAAPRVLGVVPFGGNDANEMLRLAACLEEHYPHSLANAVVREAKLRGLNHEEYHSGVSYVVAHGIASTVQGKKVVIGSYHFVFEDEGCRLPAGEEDIFEALPDDCSHLYLAVSGVLSAVICIYDPLRAEAPAAIAALHALGIRNIVMMTGDNEKTAASVARAVGVDRYFAEVLPSDKAAFIRRERAKGHVVMMIGDGVNDTPALSEADIGIAIRSGAAIAKEVADITVSSEDLFCLVTLRALATALMHRIQRNYRAIVGINLSLILCGVCGILAPTASALLHNLSTLLISLGSMRDLLPQPSSLGAPPEAKPKREEKTAAAASPAAQAD